MPKSAASSAKNAAPRGTNTIPVFWTSGWDSTYMLLKLLRDGYTVQPIYIINPRRDSRQYELRAMQQISAAITQKTQATQTSQSPQAPLPGTLLPLATYSLDDIPANKAITESYQAILQQCDLGYQYEYLARFAAAHHDEYPMIALGIEQPHDEYSGCISAIEYFGAFAHPTASTPFATIDLDRSQPALRALFSNFCFPIADITEQQMRQDIQDWGYTDIMRHIWFCHSPIDGQPCGTCRPCQQKIDCGMSWLLPASALHVNHTRRQSRKVIARTKQSFSPDFDPATDPLETKFRRAHGELLRRLNDRGYYGCLVLNEDFDGARTFSRHFYPLDDLNYEERGPISVDALFDRSALMPTSFIPHLPHRGVTYIAQDKFRTYQHLAEYQPRTQRASDLAEFHRVIHQLPADSLFVVKPLDQYGGRGIQISTPAELLQSPPADFPVIIQEFIESAHGIPGLVDGRHDFRVVILNGEITNAAIRQPRSGGFLSNTHQGGSLTLLPASDIPPAVRELALQVDSKLPPHPRFYSADFLYSAERDRWYLLELNYMPGFEPSDYSPIAAQLQERLTTALIDLIQ